MTVSLAPLARMQFNQNGIPLAGGLLFTYAAGTATKLNTYTDYTGLTPNQNPLQLNANGECDLWLTDNLGYKFVLAPADDTDPPTNPFWTKDHISNIPSSTPSFDSVTVIGGITMGGAINKVTITPPATSATLTLADLSTLATSGAHSITLTSTADTNVTLPTSGTLVSTTTFANGQVPIGNGTGFTAATLTAGANIMITNGAGSISIAAQLNPPSLIRSARTSNTILGLTDNATLIDITSGTFTQTFDAAATLGSGWYCYIRNAGTGDITLDPNASETIDGLTSYLMYPNETRLVQCDGTAFHTVVVTAYRRRYSSSATWTKPPGYKSHSGIVGSAGGSGGKNSTPVGGPGGGTFPFTLSSTTLGATESVVIGAGGAAVTTPGTVGNSGGDSNFGSWITVAGAVRGNSDGGLSGAVKINSVTLSVATGVPDGYGTSTIGTTQATTSCVWAGGCAVYMSATGANSGSSIYGGGAGAGINSGGTVYTAGTSVYAGNGGAASVASSGTNGTYPCGGGGATVSGTQSGAGADGFVDVWGDV